MTVHPTIHTEDERKAKERAYNKIYYLKHRSKILASVKAYREANLEGRRAYGRAYCEVNREKARAYAKSYYWANSEKIAAYKKAHREKIIAQQRAYREANPEKIRAKNARRRALKRNVCGASYTTAEHIKARWAMWGDRCYICGALAEATDHVIPLAKGGPHWPANLRPICTSCNSRKGTLPIEEVQKIARL